MTTNDERRARIKNGIVEMHQIGQGVWSFALWPVDQFRAIEAAAEAGGIEEVKLLAAFQDYYRDVYSRSTNDPPVHCITCEQPFGGGVNPAALATLGPSVPNSARRFVSGVCDACCQREDLIRQIHAQYQTIMPGLRRINVGAAGHA